MKQIEFLESELEKDSRFAKPEYNNARINIQKHIKKALEKIFKEIPALKEYLEYPPIIITGQRCSYNPRPNKTPHWILEPEGPFIERKKIMRTLCKRAGVRYFRYHALRHFGASLLEQANVPVGSIQRLLGHENRATTELYLHSIGDSERQAMDVLNERFDSFSHTDSHTNKKDSQAEPCKSLI